MKIKIGLFIFLLTISVSSQLFSAPIQWTEGTGANGNWYELIHNGSYLTWNTANSYAIASQHNGINGHLLTYTSAEENTWVYENLILPLLVGDYGVFIWFGATIEYNGNWEWVTGETWNYENWHPGEPNNLPQNPGEVDAVGSANYKGVFESEDRYGDAPVDWYNSTYTIEYYLVEYEDDLVNPIPEPMTIITIMIGCITFAIKKARQ